MLNRNQHIIARQVLEVDFFDKEEVVELQDRLSKIFNEKATPAIEKLFDQSISSDQLLRIDHLELDIGSFDENWDEDELVERIIEGLTEELSRLMWSAKSISTTDDTISNTSGKQGDLQLLSYFIQHGHLPWWHSKTAIPNWSQLLSSLLENEKKQFKIWVEKVGQQQQVRMRMVHQLDNEGLCQIVQLIEPTHATYINTFHSDVIKIQWKQQLVKNDTASLEKSVWEFILDYLFLENQSFFNKLHFVEMTLKKLAARYNLRYAEMLEFFTGAFSPVVQTKSNDLHQLLVILSERHRQSFFNIKQLALQKNPIYSENEDLNFKGTASKIPEENRNEHPLILELLKYYLKYGSLPAYGEGESFEHLQKWLESASGEELLELSKMLTIPASSTRIIKLLTEKQLNVLSVALFKQEVRVQDQFFAALVLIIQLELQKEKSIARKLVYDIFLAIKNKNETSFLAQMAKKLNISSEVAIQMMLFAQARVHATDTMLSNERQEEIGRELGKTETTVPVQPKTPAFNPADNQEQAVYFHDLIRYYIEHGDIPKWAERVYVSDFVSFFKSLANIDVDLFVALVKYAVKDHRSRLRLLAILPMEILADLLLEHGIVEQKAIIVFNQLLQLLHVSSLSAAHLLQPFKQVLASVYLEIFGLSNFSHQLAIEFVQKAVQYLLVNIPSTRLEILKALKDTREDTSGWLEELLEESLADAAWTKRQLLDFTAYDEIIQTIHGNIGTQNPLFADSKVYQRSKYLEVLAIFSYYFQNKSLPMGYTFSATEKAAIEKAAIHFLSQWKLKYPQDEALTDELQAIAAESLAREIDQYLQSLSLPNYARTEEPQVLKELEAMIGGVDENLGNNEQLNLRALRYFLSEGKLPQHYVFSSSNEELALLKKLLEVTVEANFSNLKVLFEEASFNEKAMAKLMSLAYDSWANPVLALLLEQFMEQHIESISSYLGLAKLKSGRILLAIFSKPNQKRFHMLIVLLKHSGFRLHLAKASVVNDVLAIIEQQNLGFSDNFSVLVQGMYQWMSKKMSDSLERDHLKHLLNEFLLIQLIGKTKFVDASSFTVAFLNFLLARRHALFVQVQQALTEEQQNTDQIVSLLKNSIQTPAKIFTEKERAERELDEKYERILENEYLLTSDHEAITENDGELDGQTFYIQNAGLVILHPYLKPFFNNLGLLKNGEFISKSARFKAIHALQYLIDGQLKHSENELLLNKILCGWPLKAPVPFSVKLSDAQRQHCSDFLSAVLSMWEKMKTSSHSNFRGAFLKRDGLLANEHGDWNLKVEPAGYDVLLRTLPWGFGVIKNSLMDTTIYVEWTV